MYESMAKNRGTLRENQIGTLKRSEWQQPADTLPPLHKRLPGQRRRRVIGSFPETENDVSMSFSVAFILSFQRIINLTDKIIHVIVKFIVMIKSHRTEKITFHRSALTIFRSLFCFSFST